MIFICRIICRFANHFVKIDDFNCQKDKHELKSTITNDLVVELYEKVFVLFFIKEIFMKILHNLFYLLSIKKLFKVLNLMRAES